MFYLFVCWYVCLQCNWHHLKLVILQTSYIVISTPALVRGDSQEKCSATLTLWKDFAFSSALLCVLSTQRSTINVVVTAAYFQVTVCFSSPFLRKFNGLVLD
ncbi:hypothetical protein OUZ56_002657 [Daphnia magna]|uniref:Secreted protein n=1 Tax=Daphnia magna TaxID=35525 RepID=A0ABR0A6D1_9CRUS|nr:hypothetical protein OUZ56_002657 [Daphnia magna]